ncbi:MULTISPECIES: carbohydrate porin [unclassified Hahella]|uniref:carbohydrate porin n=1 Tax=unclassified Hahella TaxID=2624107 RepID=UPI001C1EAF1F|nr:MULTISPECIES: carbohydrate porin [unclassified Hahella]MBU6952784.1 carbohydrate porin [Hahella sp. HN01]MDG9670265.1 carbohydrate porin [Hahella sp. CR1]
MNNKYFMKTLPLAVSLALGISQAHAEFGIGANIELDTDIIDAKDSDTKFEQGGRIEVNVTGKTELNGYFVEGKGSGLLKKNGDTATDDMWVKFGNETWDVQAGRFEAVNLFPLGKDTVVAHAGDGKGARVYEANLVRGRAGDNGGQFALHVRPSSALSFELASIWGDSDENGNNEEVFSGLRPSVTFTGEMFSLTAGYEVLKYDQETTSGGVTTKTEIDKSGFGLTGNIRFSGASINLNAAREDIEDAGSDITVTSFGANVTYGAFGLGAVHSISDTGAKDDPTVSTLYVAYTLPLFNIDNASITFAGSTSSADHLAGDTDDDLHKIRTRINYTF